MRLYFIESDGNAIEGNSLPTDSLRCALNEARITIPKNTNICCFCRHQQLYLDLSLSYQGIKDSDTISILMQKHKTHTTKNTKTSLLLNLALQEEKRQKEMLDEFVRVSDVSFILLDASPAATSTYQMMYEHQQMQAEQNQQEIPPETTVIPQKTDSPIIEPLPKCFDNDSEIQETEPDSESVDSYDPHYSNIVYSNRKGEYNNN